MEDIVAIKVIDAEQKTHFFLTWGRIFGTVDPAPLLEIISAHLQQFGLSTPQKIEVCATLQEAAAAPSFHEGFFYFCQQRIPYGKPYDKWRLSQQRRLKKGKQIYYIGHGATKCT